MEGPRNQELAETVGDWRGNVALRRNRGTHNGYDYGAHTFVGQEELDA
jgi:hypothetical protein